MRNRKLWIVTVCILTLTCLLSLITGCKDWFNNDEDVNVEENKLYFSEENYIIDRLALLTLGLNYTGEEEIVWATSNDEVVMVVDGTVLGLKSGDCEITATVGEEQAKCKVSVSSAFAEVEFSLSHSNVDIVKGQELQIKANVKVNGQTVTEKTFVNYKYTSLNTEVVNVSQTGLITAVNGGVANVEVVAEYGGQRIFENIAVSVKEDVTVTFDKAEVVLFDQNINEFTNSEEQLIVYVYEGEDLVTEPVLTWKSENEEIVTVDTNGIVYGVARGQAKVLVEYLSTLGEKVVAETIVNVKDAVAEYTLKSPDSNRITISDTGLVTWESVENAASYVVNVNGEDFDTTSTEYQTQSSKSSLAVKIKSIGQGIWYDSDYSSEVYGLVVENLKEPIIADFAGKAYETMTVGVDSSLITNEFTNEGSVMKVTLEVSDWTYFNLNLPKAPSGENITIRFMLPDLVNVDGLSINGGNSGKFYEIVAGEWFSITRPVGTYGSKLNVSLHTKTPMSAEIYFSLVVDGEYTNEQMRNMKVFGDLPEEYLADYSSESYESLVTGGSYGADIVNEYMPTYANEENVLKISATTRVATACLRLHLPKQSTKNKVTLKYRIDETYGIAGDLKAIVNTKYTEAPICELPKEPGIWYQVEIDLSNQTEKDKVELMFNQTSGGILTVMYLSFVYDGVAPKEYLADYSSEAYESLVTGGSYGADIVNEYMPTYANETNVLKISATTRVSTACLRLHLPIASSKNKVTIKYMIDETYGIAGDLSAIVNTKYTEAPICSLSKEQGVWHVAEIDLSNQTEKDVIELMFNQTGAGIQTVIYLSFVYDGVLN